MGHSVRIRGIERDRLALIELGGRRSTRSALGTGVGVRSVTDKSPPEIQEHQLG